MTTDTTVRSGFGRLLGCFTLALAAGGFTFSVAWAFAPSKPAAETLPKVAAGNQAQLAHWREALTTARELYTNETTAGRTYSTGFTGAIVVAFLVGLGAFAAGGLKKDALPPDTGRGLSLSFCAALGAALGLAGGVDYTFQCREASKYHLLQHIAQGLYGKWPPMPDTANELCRHAAYYGILLVVMLVLLSAVIHVLKASAARRQA